MNEQEKKQAQQDINKVYGIKKGSLNLTIKENIMNEPNENEYPTYEEVVKKMMKYISDEGGDDELRGSVLMWLSEFNEAFYPFMCKIVDIMNNIDEDDFTMREDAGINKEQEKFIEWFGALLDRRGGIQTQQGNYYVMYNFMECRRVHILNYMWNDIGEWKR